MEVWTFINIKTNEIIRFHSRAGDIEFGIEYYFTDNEYYPLWFVHTEDEAKLAYSDWVHPQFSMHPKQPATDRININDYEICKFELNEITKNNNINK